MHSPSRLIGLDIGGTHVRAALTTGTDIVAARTAAWPRGLSPDQEVRFVSDMALELIKDAAPGCAVSAAGVSLAALVDKDGTVVNWPNRPAWRGVAFRPLLEQRLRMPVVVEDDANAAALAECKLGAARECRHALAITAGTGIGGGIVLDGRLFRGANGWAGEVGHMIVCPDGPPCACGMRGCLQAVASGRALERVATERGLKGAADVASAAARGEEWALVLLTDFGRRLGIAAANLVCLLDLEAVVVGGGLMRLGHAWWSAVGEALRENLFNVKHRSVALYEAELSDRAGLMGAILLASELAAANEFERAV
jgi:glucokinase